MNNLSTELQISKELQLRLEFLRMLLYEHTSIVNDVTTMRPTKYKDLQEGHFYKAYRMDYIKGDRDTVCTGVAVTLSLEANGRGLSKCCGLVSCNGEHEQTVDTSWQYFTYEEIIVDKSIAGAFEDIAKRAKLADFLASIDVDALKAALARAEGFDSADVYNECYQEEQSHETVFVKVPVDDYNRMQERLAYLEQELKSYQAC